MDVPCGAFWGIETRQGKYATPPTPEERERYRRFIEYEAERLTIAAAALGVVVTIECQPMAPLAMGNYVMVAGARLARERTK